MRLTLKFLHTLGAIGLMGAMASLLAAVLWASLAAPATRWAAVGAMAQIAGLVFLPALALTLLSGLLAIAATPAFHDAAWVWIKLATGISVFEGGLVYIQGPIQAAAKAGAAPADLAHTLTAESHTLVVLLLVALVNVALGVWRPRMPQIPF